MNKSVFDIIEDAVEQIEDAIKDLPYVSASKIGLDVRAGYIYVDQDNECIIAKGHNIRSLEYYGGFEYVDGDATVSIGEYKIYTHESERVKEAVDHYVDQDYVEEEV